MFILFGLSALSLRGSPSTTSCARSQSGFDLHLGQLGVRSLTSCSESCATADCSFHSSALRRQQRFSVRPISTCWSFLTNRLGSDLYSLIVLSTWNSPRSECPLSSGLCCLFFFSAFRNTLGRFSFVSVSQRIATKACHLHVTLAKPVALEERRLRGFAFCKLWKTVFSVVQRSGKNSDRCKNLHPGL